MDEKIKILMFGVLAERSGAGEINFEWKKDTDLLISELKIMYPVLKENKFSIAVNKKMIMENSPLKPGDEVALMPPFSGG